MNKRTSKMLRFFSRVISMLLVVVLLTQDALGSGSITLASVLEQEIETQSTETQGIENELDTEVIQTDTGEETTVETSEAPGSSGAESEQVSDAESFTESEEEPQILFEVEALRDQREKHYRLSDGTIMASEYAMDVHFEDEEGSWKDIDNRFRYETADAADPMEGYATADGAVEFKFAPDASGEVVRATNGEYSVSFELVADDEDEYVAEEIVTAAEETEAEESVPITFIKGEILNGEAVPAGKEVLTAGTFTLNSDTQMETAGVHSVQQVAETDDADPVWAGDWDTVDRGTDEAESLVEQAALDHVVTSVGYENIIPGTSLQYITSGSSLKEYILVGARQESYRYTFAMDLENLVPEMQEDNSILLMDEDSREVIYEIPAAYMTDAKGEYSDSVAMFLEETGDGTWLLVVDADEEWINSPDRTFPVQIDPTLNARLSSSTGIRGNYVRQGQANVSSTNYGEMYVGYDSSGNKKMITYIQLRNLPALPEDSIICGAVFNMAVLSYSQVATPAMYVQAKEVTEATTWSSSYTWNSRPATGSIVLDQQAVTAGSYGKYVGWNITELVKKHYMDGNVTGDILAFALEAYGTMYNSKCANAAFNLLWSGAEPIFQVMYRDTRGVEGYYTYQTQDIGNAGTAYVSDYTSQLTVMKPVGSYNSTIMPYELGLVYNSSYSDRYFSNDTVNNADIYTKDFSSMYIGAGWKLTAQETIVEVPVTDLEGTTTYLVHLDSDGTAHYFQKSETDSTVYKDEDGLNLTISKSGNNYVMVDKKDNKKCFTNGCLTTIEDANGNAIHILYNGRDVTNNVVNLSAPNYISSIVAAPKDGTVETIFEFYYEQNHLSEIRDNYKRRCLLDHSLSKGGKWEVARIYHYDPTGEGAYVQNAEYLYDAGHLAMTHAFDTDSGTGVQYDYEASETGHRVKGFHEYAANSVSGTQEKGVSITSSSDFIRRTAYTDAGTDRMAGNDDDIITTYLFNSAGQTSNAMSTDKKGNLLGVTASAYEKNSGTSAKNNRTSNSITSGQAGVDILGNGGFEFPADSGNASPSATADGWTHGGTGSVARRKTGNGPSYSGAMHYNFYNGSATGSAKIQRGVTLEAGKTYTLSAYVNTSQAAAFADGGGVYLQLLSSAGTTLAKSTVFSYQTDPEIDSGWQRISTSYTTPSAGTATVVLCWENAHGSMYADNLQLEAADAPSRFNYVYNGSFEIAGAAGWTLSSGAASATADKKHGTNAVSASGKPGTLVYAEQTIRIDRSSNTSFLLSGWSKGNSIPGLETEIAGKTDTSLKYWGMTLTLNYEEEGVASDHFNLPFSDFVTDWQYAATAIAPKTADKTISTAVLRLCYQNNANTAYFDNISLIEEPAQTYKYDDKGNMISVKSSGNGEDGYKFDANNNLMSVATEGSGDYTYEYKNANKHLPTKVTNDTVDMEVSYDEYGRTTGTTLKSTATASYPTMSSTTDYENGLLKNVTDNTGAKTSYGYDARRRQNAVQDAAGRVTNTSYDERWERPAMVYQSGVISLGYTYSGGDLIRISRGGYLPGSTTDKQTQEYHFAYDSFGNMTGVAAGSYKLAEYLYNAGNGTLEQMNYGTSGAVAKINYAYDDLDRMVQAVYSDNKGSVTYGYLYSSEGNLSGITENGELLYTYDYDTLGRLIHSSALENGDVVLYTAHKYDTSDRILSQTWQIGDDGFEERYEYNTNDGTLKTMVVQEDTLNFGYDALKRLSAREVVLPGNDKLVTTDYTYKTDTSKNTTTTQVESISYVVPESTTSIIPKLTYTYDAMGNITKVQPYGETATTYTYGSQNQLLKETKGNSSDTYTYDTYGNIRTIQKNESGYTSSYTLSYNDSTWLDRLTSVSYTNATGGTTTKNLVYDEIGNPTTYYNGSKTLNMSWRYGRQLSNVVNGSSTYSYTYDVDGIRKSKTVNGTVHDYVTLDGKVVRETWGSTAVIDYFYDNEGKPYKISVKNGSSTYEGYYLLNQQGDVIAIIDGDGDVLVEYTYNAWGKQTAYSTSGTAGSRLYTYNALKYRGYYYDSETGFYYVSSRYYDPVIGRFINADDTAVLSVDQGSLLQYNLFVYCLNNPVNRIDESGYLSISILAKGASLVATGLAAIGVAAAVVTCGVATPVMLGVAAITMGAGALTTINGVSDIGEAISGHNVVRDTVFKGNAKAYNTYSAITTTVSAVGSIACGGWLAANKPRISAYNNIQDYDYTNTISDANHMNRPYNNSVLMQKQIIKYGKMTKDSGGFGYIFTASGAVNKTTKMWRLGVNVAKRLVWHFGHGF